MRGFVLLLAWLLVARGAVAAPAVVDRCAACHFVNFLTVPAATHLDEWAHSPHAARGVGCAACHGGDAAASEATAAHRGVLNSRNPASRVHWRNLPKTCGECHTSEFNAFTRSGHYVLLEQGDPASPGCASCHGAMAALTPSPYALRVRCAACHPRPSGPTDRPRVAQGQLEDLLELQTKIVRAGILVSHVDDETRRRQLDRLQHDAVTALARAVLAVHSFDLNLVADRLTAARQAVGRLVAATEAPR